MWHAANMAFDLCPLLTQGAIDAIELCGTPEQKAKFLPSMVSGEWTGTMNLTEPQAGSDLAAVRTRAVPQDDGSYKLFGQKIFITFGEHDFTDNIIHLVLARTPTAPEGVKGISLFLVPKFLVNADGSLGARNDVHCVSLEHKLGIHASPTAVLAYGDQGGATGYLIGEENRGLEYMFIMMNQARFSVGMEGVGLSERAYQRAVAYARERVQGKAPGAEKAVKAGPIIDHPDIRRMLMTMRAYTEAMRAVGYVTAAAIDNARHAPEAATRAQRRHFLRRLRAPALDDRDHQVDERLVLRAGRRVGRVTRVVDRRGGDVADGAHRFGVRAHRHQHPADVGMIDDRTRLGRLLGARRLALHAIARIRDRALVRALGQPDAFHAHREARLVHHDEHVLEAAVLLADQVAGRRRRGRRTRARPSGSRGCRACARATRNARRCARRASRRR